MRKGYCGIKCSTESVHTYAAQQKEKWKSGTVLPQTYNMCQKILTRIRGYADLLIEAAKDEISFQKQE